MHDWYLRSRNLVHRDIADAVPLLRGVREEEQISTVERGFHRSAEQGPRKFVQSGNSVFFFQVNLREGRYLRTTTMGDSVLVRSPRPFQIMRPEAMTEVKFSICSRT